VDEEIKLVPGKPHQCPSCGRKDIRPSVVRGARDGFMRMCGFLPWRCRACERRFYRKMRVAEDVEENSAAAQ
jgi:hypothetical protein